MGTVRHIHIAHQASQPMLALPQAEIRLTSDDELVPSTADNM